LRSHIGVCIGACSHCNSITWLNDILRSNCNASTKVHNYKAFNTGLQTKDTAGGGNYNYTVTVPEKQ